MNNILVGGGGGIVSITAAYFAKQKDTNVVLIEADNELGGLLKSDCNDYGCFDYQPCVAFPIHGDITHMQSIIKELEDM